MANALKCEPVYQSKILLIDIETAPILGLSWQLFQTDIIHVLEPTTIMSFAYQWLGKPKINFQALWHAKDYRQPKKNATELEALLNFYANNKAAERWLVQQLWNLLDDADLVIAHNGDRFDIKKINARLIVHGFLPPTPYTTIDTLKIARKYFKFDSNKLDNIGGYLEIGRKLAHTGKHLWLGCMRGERKSQQTMGDYNVHDVRLLASVYDRLKPWHNTHPILTAIAPQKQTACPTCLSANVQRRGWAINKVRKTPRYQCQSCGSWFSGWNLGGGKDARKTSKVSA